MMAFCSFSHFPSKDNLMLFPFEEHFLFFEMVLFPSSDRFCNYNNASCCGGIKSLEKHVCIEYLSDKKIEKTASAVGYNSNSDE